MYPPSLGEPSRSLNNHGWPPIFKEEQFFKKNNFRCLTYFHDVYITLYLLQLMLIPTRNVQNQCLSGIYFT